MNRVVVTGLGALTPIGLGVKPFWDNIKKGHVGIGPITYFDTTDYKAKVAGELKGYQVKDYLDRKIARKYDAFSQYAVIASKEAIEDAGLDLSSIDLNRTGTSIGSGIGALWTIEKEEGKLQNKGPHRVSPMLIPKCITNMAAGNVAVEYGLKGKNINVVTACASGSHSIGEAYRTIQFGSADLMLAGGAEASICPLGIAGFANMTALSEQTDPLKASRPFDKDRDGFVMGEGAGVLVLESLDHAKKRGAHILAEVVGYGATCDAYHMTSPAEDGDGAARAMLEAVNEAGIQKEEVNYINAHGTSTPYNDLFETRAIKKAFASHANNLVVNSTKSMIGHLLGAAGGVEAVTVVKSLQDQYVHQTVGLERPGEECDLDYLAGKGREMEVNYAISNSLGFGGHNASLLFKRYKGE